MTSSYTIFLTAVLLPPQVLKDNVAICMAGMGSVGTKKAAPTIATPGAATLSRQGDRPPLLKYVHLHVCVYIREYMTYIIYVHTCLCQYCAYMYALRVWCVTCLHCLSVADSAERVLSMVDSFDESRPQTASQSLLVSSSQDKIELVAGRCCSCVPRRHGTRSFVVTSFCYRHVRKFRGNILLKKHRSANTSLGDVCRFGVTVSGSGLYSGRASRYGDNSGVCVDYK